MKNWKETDENDIARRGRLCRRKERLPEIGIPFYSVNLLRNTGIALFTYFLEEYKKGRTPNPGRALQQRIKIPAFLDYAKHTLGARPDCNGHYARTEMRNESIRLLKGLDPKKDQSNFLSFLSNQQLGNALFLWET